uniref:Uncharacterized protein n=1 Tax=Aegilops tauschii subsp. strangulata TaxID=200361 RepID=A0A453DE61_AEGTS
MWICLTRIRVKFPELYGSMHVAYNARPGPLPPQGYTYLSWPQSLQLYGGAPIFDSAHPGSFPQAHAHPSRPQVRQLLRNDFTVHSEFVRFSVVCFV